MAFLTDYDAWKTEEPIHGDGVCPECCAPTIINDIERSEDCTECDFTDGFDWDAEADRIEAERMGWG